MLGIAHTTLRLVAHKPKSQALFVLISSGVHEKKAGSSNASFMEILFELFGSSFETKMCCMNLHRFSELILSSEELWGMCRDLNCPESHQAGLYP